MKAKTNPPFMTGVPELLVLRLLKARAMYGYEIVAELREQSGAVIQAGEGVIYPVLHALEKDGALKASRKAVNGRSRVYYSLTDKGQKRLEGLSQEWSRIAEAVGAMLKGERHEPAF
nr:PadR family transcriptional regulator [Rhizomicrobium palustre]